MMKKEEAAAMEKDKMAKEGDAMAKDDAMSKQGSYVTLADYNKDPSKYADSKKVLLSRELVPNLPRHR